jgi:hypothetical protein
MTNERAAELWLAIQEVCDQYRDLQLRASSIERHAIMFRFALRTAGRGHLVGGCIVFLDELAERPVALFRAELLSAASRVHAERAMTVPEGWGLNVERVAD